MVLTDFYRFCRQMRIVLEHLFDKGRSKNPTMYVIYKNTCIFDSSNFHRACNSN